MAAETEQAKIALEKRLAKQQTIAAAQPKSTLAKFIAEANTAASAVQLDEADTRKLIDQQLRQAGWEADSQSIKFKAHNLMQAIARVNRVHGDKPGGLVVDYQGIAADLKEALSFYSDAGGKGDPALAQEQAASLMLEKLEVVSAMYHGFAYENYFEADTTRKLSLILAAE